MPMLTEHLDAVIGVDTHTDSHSAAICDARGAVLAELTVSADAQGYQQLLDAALTHCPGPRILWAVEGTASHGRGLTTLLTESGQDVCEVEHPKRSAPRKGKSDPLDALRAARGVFTAKRRIQPRRTGTREALRLLVNRRDQDVSTRTRVINRLKADVLTAPEALRAQLRGLSTTAQVATCATLRVPRGADTEMATRIHVLHSAARQIRTLSTEITDAETRLIALTRQRAPRLLAETGVGPIVAAQLLITWSHRDRFTNDGEFAMIGGTAPLEMSSGRNTRHRLNRLGDRNLNNALHTAMMTRKRCHPETQAYYTRRLAEGKTPHMIDRCIKRAITRRFFKILQTLPEEA